MACNITPRQLQFLELLLNKRSGLTIDAISNALEISRTAVVQHFSGLQKQGCVEDGSLDKKAGRPVRSYVITEKGINHFPKQYAWFSEIILNRLKQQMGSDVFLRIYGAIRKRW